MDNFNIEPISEPLLTVLNFSGGTQSTCILWMLIRGDLPLPDNLVVIFADAGMENNRTYRHVDTMFRECKEVNIECYKVSNGSLYEDLINLKSSKKTRLDLPPYFTKSDKGKVGKLKQSCTKNYKIKPINTKIREVLEEKFNISRYSKRLGENIVRLWIGFNYDEVFRIKPSSKKFTYFEYPLIDLKMTQQDVEDYYKSNGLPFPSRSVCNACFANGLNYYKNLYENDKAAWSQAVNVDNSIRDCTQLKIRDEVYVSSTVIPLEDLAKMNFKLDADNKDKHSCDSGFCFT